MVLIIMWDELRYGWDIISSLLIKTKLYTLWNKILKEGSFSDQNIHFQWNTIGRSERLSTNGRKLLQYCV